MVAYYQVISMTIKWFDGQQVPEVIYKIQYRDDSDDEPSYIEDSDEESESVSYIYLILLIYKLF